MRAIIPEIRKHGVDVVFVGSGRAWQAAAFREDLALDAPPCDATVLVDPELKSFRVAGFHRGVAGVLALSTLKNAVRALRAGHRQAKVQGDAWQNGGVLLVDRSGAVRWRYASASAGDHPGSEAILAAVAGAFAGEDRQ